MIVAYSIGDNSTLELFENANMVIVRGASFSASSLVELRVGTPRLTRSEGGRDGSLEGGRRT